MKLTELGGSATPLGHRERIKLFGWWLHTHGNRPTFKLVEIVKCYEPLHLAAPNTIGPIIAQLVETGDLLKDKQRGYRLEASVRMAHDQRYGQAPTTVAIKAILAGLPEYLPTLAESAYLNEALTCYKSGAVRATIVMTWNLAYAHLCDHIVKNKLAEFNTQWQTAYAGDHKKGSARDQDRR